MAAHLIRLKLRLMVNGWRRSTMQLVLTVIGLAYLAGMLGLVAFGMVALAGESIEVRGTALVLAMSVAVVLWLVIPVFISGVDPTLDPVNFLTFGIRPRTLVIGLLLAGMITLAGLGTLLGLLVLIAAIGLLFTGRYLPGLFALNVGLNRWVYRVASYVLLLRDEYPPFRLDQGPTEPVPAASEQPGPAAWEQPGPADA